MANKFTKSKTYMALKWIFIISAVYEIIISLFFVLGMFINTEKNNFLFPTNDVIFISLFTAVLIAAVVLINTRFKLAAPVSGLIPQIPLAIIFARQCEDPYRLSGLLVMYYWRHLAPIIIMTISLIWLAIGIAGDMREEKLAKKAYNKQF